MLKRCTKCGEEKDETEFYAHKGKYLRPDCKKCTNEKNRKWYAEHKIEKLEYAKRSMKKRYYTRIREQQLLKKYGITNAQYEEILARQNHCCAVCGKHESEFKKKLSIDHDHVSGLIRGLLCNHCNHYIVGRHRQPDLLRKAADYLENGNTGYHVPRTATNKRRRARRKRQKRAVKS